MSPLDKKEADKINSLALNQQSKSITHEKQGKVIEQNTVSPHVSRSIQQQNRKRQNSQIAIGVTQIYSPKSARKREQKPFERLLANTDPYNRSPVSGDKFDNYNNQIFIDEADDGEAPKEQVDFRQKNIDRLEAMKAKK